MANRFQFVPKIENSFLNAETADFHVECISSSGQKERVPVHKLILSMGSVIFKETFSKPFVNLMTLYSVSPDAFKEFLHFFYSDNVKLTVQNAAQVMQLMQGFKVTQCVTEFKVLLRENLTKENVCWAYPLTIFSKYEGLQLFCEEEIIWNAEEILKSNDFLNASHSCLDNILKLNYLASNESTVLNACIGWAKNACERDHLDTSQPQNVRKKLGDILHQIRFRSISFDDICTVLPGMGFSAEEHIEIIQLIGSKEFQSETFNNELRLKPFTRDGNRILVIKRYDPLIPEYVWKTNQNRKMCETTEFSTNKTILLGEIQCIKVTWNKFIGNIPDSKFNIVENDISSGSTKSKTIYEGLIKLGANGTHHILPQPILIKAVSKYQINIEQPPKSFTKADMALFTLAEINDVKIKFHDQGNGLVTALLFNRLNI